MTPKKRTLRLRAVRVYATKPSESRPVALRKLDLGAAGAATLFPGPAWPSLPRCATGS